MIPEAVINALYGLALVISAIGFVIGLLWIGFKIGEERIEIIWWGIKAAAIGGVTIAVIGLVLHDLGKWLRPAIGL